MFVDGGIDFFFKNHSDIDSTFMSVLKVLIAALHVKMPKIMHHYQDKLTHSIEYRYELLRNDYTRSFKYHSSFHQYVLVVLLPKTSSKAGKNKSTTMMCGFLDYK